MKILCLHGRGTNASVLETQLAPVIYELRKLHNLELHFVNGPFEKVDPWPGVAGMYDGHFYNFLTDQGFDIQHTAKIVRRVGRKNLEPEDHCRELREHGMDLDASSACDIIEKFVRECSEAPFDGILGLLEGASVAISYLLRRPAAGEGNYAFKFGIFIIGIVAYHWQDQRSILPDETSQRVGIPTAHIMGSKDPGHKASLTLLRLCDERVATSLMHQGSHEIPWDPAVTRDMVQLIRGFIERSKVA